MFGMSKKENNIFWILKSYIAEMRVKVKEERKKEKELNEKLDTDKKEQLKLFKIFFTVFFLLFVAAIYISSMTKYSLLVLLIEGIVALVFYILFKCKVKIFNYHSVCLMPCIAYGCTIFLIVILYLIEPSSPKQPIQENENPTNTEQTIQ